MSDSVFQKTWELEPMGDQPAAIKKLVDGVNNQKKDQVLLGVTGSGKTFTMANVIVETNRPALILAHNKTLAAQLFQEFKELFPQNAVEYFISYYDYYQPEAYVPSSDTFIEKTASINEDIDKMRHSATRSLLERRDVIIVSSVSCIYGLGNPESYLKARLALHVGQRLQRDEFLLMLISIQYSRNDISLERGKFRVRGDVIEIVPSYEKDVGIRLQFWGNTLEKISYFDVIRGKVTESIKKVTIYPATHYVLDKDSIERVIGAIARDLGETLDRFRQENKLIEAHRLETRTLHDIEMIRELGYCQGVENYSRYMDGRNPGEPPGTLLDFFPEDYLVIIDESHVTIPQIGGMYRGDRSRKETLVNYGFRLPAALDNRPLNFEEFEARRGQTIFVSATPGKFELEKAKDNIVEQIIRPTGLVDPIIEIKPAIGQVDDLLFEIQKTIARKGRVLVTTLTKKMSEDLTNYYADLNLKVKYLHSEIQTLERVQILRELRLGIYDILIGINLLREGLDLPEVELVAILDGDKEGFLRSRTSLIQTVGRAARNVSGRVIIYAEKMTDSIVACLDETNRRRTIQLKYNEDNNINPKTITKKIADDLKKIYHLDYGDEHQEKLLTLVESLEFENKDLAKNPKKIDKLIQKLTKDMHKAAAKMDFEEAANLRDKIQLMREYLLTLLENQS